jgi:uncharacterized protein YkwD
MLPLAIVLAASSRPAHAGALDETMSAHCALDPRLEPAAREALAQHDPIDSAALRALAEAHGLFAPSVRAWVARGDEAGVRALAEQWLSQQRVPLAWARCALAREGEQWAIALAPRAAEVSRGPSNVSVGSVTRVAVQLPEGARALQLVVARPDGTLVRSAPEAEVHFDVVGEYTLQLVAATAQGPLPFATWHITAGTPSSTSEPTTPRTPLADARALLVAINRARTQAAVPPLRHDPLLASLAHERATELAQQGLVTHAVAQDDTPVTRLRVAHVAADRVAENVARARTLTEASARLEGSPSHRANRLDPMLDAVGLGIAVTRQGVYLVELYAARPRLVDPSPETN